MFVHTFFSACAIIIDVTPPIHYIVFATPHKKRNTFSEKRISSPGWSFFMLFLQFSNSMVKYITNCFGIFAKCVHL